MQYAHIYLIKLMKIYEKYTDNITLDFNSLYHLHFFYAKICGSYTYFCSITWLALIISIDCIKYNQRDIILNINKYNCVSNKITEWSKPLNCKIISRKAYPFLKLNPVFSVIMQNGAIKSWPESGFEPNALLTWPARS